MVGFAAMSGLLAGGAGREQAGATIARRANAATEARLRFREPYLELRRGKPCLTPAILPDAYEPDVEDERRVGGNAADGLIAVAEAGRNDQPALAADAHADDALVPALDHLAAAERERERTVRVELPSFGLGSTAVVEE